MEWLPAFANEEGDRDEGGEDMLRALPIELPPRGPARRGWWWSGPDSNRDPVVQNDVVLTAFAVEDSRGRGQGKEGVGCDEVST